MTTTQRPGCPFALDAAGTDLHGEAKALRGLGPAALVHLPGLPPHIRTWAVTEPGLIKRLLTNPHVSKDARQHWPAYINGDVRATWASRIWVDVYNALTAYGTDHTRLRRLIAPAFTARRIRALAEPIEILTRDLVDTLAADTRADGTVDLRKNFALPLPLLVADLLLGVPAHLHEPFRESAALLFATDLTAEQANANVARMYGLLQTLVDLKREHPGEDVTTTLVDERDNDSGAGLDGPELLDTLLLLIGASYETTANLLDHAIANLASTPGQLHLIRTGRATWPDAVEETLRHQAPIANLLLRYAVEDIHDAETGTTFTKGDAIVVNYSAAGRDPRTHGPGTDHFDITRTTKDEHLAFGHGTHYCLGGELARLEGRIALKVLFERFPDLALAVPADQLQPLPSFISNGHTSLPVLLAGAPR
ncbi:cytochrome P450 [Kitasatospora sp. NPDC048540]|uniref:cytochrome P450 n=1 Tax=Kitasatospora sp. NPDC048540 TaxID=3155634 RepID=UPI0033CEF253